MLFSKRTLWGDITYQVEKIKEIVDRAVEKGHDGKLPSEESLYKLQRIGDRAARLREALQEDIRFEWLQELLGLEGATSWHANVSAQIEVMLAERFCNACGEPKCDLWVDLDLIDAPMFLWACAQCRGHLEVGALPIDLDRLSDVIEYDHNNAIRRLLKWLESQE